MFWDLVVKFTNLDFTSDTVVDKIYQVYRRGLSVTKLLVKLRQERSREGFPALGL